MDKASRGASPRLQLLIGRCARLMRNVMLDLRFGGTFLGGKVLTRYAHIGAHDTASTDYDVMPYLFNPIGITESDVLVDVGCGRGRVINWWLSQRLKNKIIGVELDPRVASETKRRLRRYGNVEIISGNILDVLPSEGTVFYLWNPFSETVLRAFKDLLVERTTRKAKILYFNPYLPDPFFENVFRDDPRWAVRPIHYPLLPVVRYSRDYALLIELVHPSQVLEAAETPS